MGRPLDRPQDARGDRRAAAVADLLALGDGCSRSCSACRSRGCSPGCSFPGRSLVRALVLLPLVLPPVVGGVGLFYAFGRDGPRRPVPLRLVRHPAHVLDRRRDPGRDVRRDAVPRDHRRGRAAVDGPALRGRGRDARRRPFDRVPPGDAAADPARPRSPAPRWRGRARSASSAPRSPSPATSRAAPRRCRSRCTCSSRRTRDVAIGLSLVLLAVCVAVLALLRDRWLGVG